MMVRSLLASKRLHSLLGLLLSLLLVAWIVLVADWSEVLSALQHARYEYIVLVLIIYFVHFALRALRWRFLLEQGSEIRLKTLFDSIMMGNFASFVLPLRAGEFIRPFLLSRESDVRFMTGFVSVVVERFFDLSTVLISFALIILVVPGIPEAIYLGAYALSSVAAGILVFMFVGGVFPAQTLRFAERVSMFLPERIRAWGIGFLRDMLDGATVLRRPLNLLIVIGLTVLVWVSAYYSFYLYLLLMDLPASWEAAVTTAVVLALAVALPSAPGFVGIYQSGCVLGLGLFAIGRDQAIAFSIVSHTVQYAVFVAYGLYLLAVRGITLGDLRRQQTA